MDNDLYMEDVHSIGLEAMKVIEDKLKPFGRTLTPEQEDEIYIPICNALEKISNGDYRSHL